MSAELFAVGGRELRGWQIQAIDDLRTSLRAGHRRPVLQAPTGVGKCLGEGTPVLLFDGRIIPVEQVRIGDCLMGPDSQPRAVLSTARGREMLYRVIPTKGDSYVVNESHILSLRLTKGANCRRSKNPGRDGGWKDDKLFNLSVREYLAASKTFRHCAKGWRAAVDFSAAEALRVDPYCLGIWLGDGSSDDPEICTGDREVAEAFRSYATTLGLIITEKPNSVGSKMFYMRREVRNPALNPFMALLVYYDLRKNKHIPPQYKTASRAERLALLAGLLDTDGYLGQGCYTLTLKSERLLDDAIFVARSLGFAAYKKQVTKTCGNNGVSGTYWTCHIAGAVSEIPCRIERKRAQPRTQKKNVLRVGIQVEPIGVGAYYGFELDGDGLFLLGDFTVTHNTALSAAVIRLALDKGKRAVFSCPAISLIDQTVQSFWRDGIRDVGVLQANHHMTDPSKPVQVCSVQTLARRTDPETDLVIVDEAHIRSSHMEAWMERANVPFIGLSATPWTKGLGNFYDDLIVAMTTQQAIDQGLLTPFKVFGPDNPSTEGMKTIGGDYHQGQASERMRKPKLIGNIVETWGRLGKGLPTLCFCVDLAHAKAVQQEFLDAGILSAYQDAYTDPAERRDIKEKFHRGAYPVVCSVGTLILGVDWDVRCIIWARLTKSEILFCQGVGRGLRPANGKDSLLILDHAGTHDKLGFVTDINHDYLHTGKPNEIAERKPPLPKKCPKCHFIRAAGNPTCPNCGFVAAPVSRVETVNGALTEKTASDKYTKLQKDRQKAKAVKLNGSMVPLRDFYGELMGYGQVHGYAPGWASNQFRGAVGVWPNSYRDAPIKQTSPEVVNWIRGQQIAYAKSRERGTR